MSGALVHTPVHHKRFIVQKQLSPGRGHSLYQIVLLRRNGMVAKRQIKGLCESLYGSAGLAKHQIRMWDLGWV